MTHILTYFAGVLTPFLAAALYFARIAFQDWRYQRRYQRAWDRFTAEYDALSEAEKVEFAATRESYERTYDDRSRWFMKRWQYGRTTEV